MRPLLYAASIIAVTHGGFAQDEPPEEDEFPALLLQDLPPGLNGTEFQFIDPAMDRMLDDAYNIACYLLFILMNLSIFAAIIC